ncbi:hypothetical protein Tco_0769088 [Tanacetum coccineum]|uniref:Xylulose kinase-1 n=1 Tax=Tanacetum coccineum TaxID=301880 RepID=A0ABQ4ZB99_9ASTR
MAGLKFVDSHNMVAFLEKPTGSGDFHQIIDFLNASYIRYALTKNPIIYVSHIEQFWSTAKIKTLNNGEQEIHVKVDGKTRVITEASVRMHLKLADENGIDFLPNTEIFDYLKTMVYERFNFSKMIFNGMLKNLDNTSKKFLMYPRIVSNNAVTKPTNYGRRNRQGIEIPQSSVPTITPIADEAVFTKVDDRHGGSATTGTGLDVGQGSGNIHKTPSLSYDSPPRGDTLEEVTTSQAVKIIRLKNRVKKVEGDANKQGRKTEELNQDPDVRVFDTTRKKGLSTASVGISTACATISTAGKPVTTAGTTIPATKMKSLQGDYRLKRKKKLGLTREGCQGRSRKSGILSQRTRMGEFLIKVETDYDFAKKMQEQERKNVPEQEREELWVELLRKRKRMLAEQKAEAKRKRLMT